MYHGVFTRGPTSGQPSPVPSPSSPQGKAETIQIKTPNPVSVGNCATNRVYLLELLDSSVLEVSLVLLLHGLDRGVELGLHGETGHGNLLLVVLLLWQTKAVLRKQKHGTVKKGGVFTRGAPRASSSDIYLERKKPR